MEKALPLRALPRVFVPGASAEGEIELPKEEVDKIRKVLRLSAGAPIAILPNDGTVVRAIFQNHVAEPVSVERPDVEAALRLTLCQALPKGDKLDEIVRAGTELGEARFEFFASERSVVRWDEKKLGDRLRRLQTIAREAAEVSFRTMLPEIAVRKDLAEVLKAHPQAVVLSEVEGLGRSLTRSGDAMAIVVGPEGGWARRELEIIGDRGVTLGPRVLRVDHAGPAAAAILLLQHA